MTPITLSNSPDTILHHLNKTLAISDMLWEGFAQEFPAPADSRFIQLLVNDCKLYCNVARKVSSDFPSQQNSILNAIEILEECKLMKDYLNLDNNSLGVRLLNLCHQAATNNASLRELEFLVSIFCNMGLVVKVEFIQAFRRLVCNHPSILEDLAQRVAYAEEDMVALSHMASLTADLMPEVLERASEDKNRFFFPNYWTILLSKLVTKKTVNDFLQLTYETMVRRNVIDEGSILYCDFAQAMKETNAL